MRWLRIYLDIKQLYPCSITLYASKQLTFNLIWIKKKQTCHRKNCQMPIFGWSVHFFCLFFIFMYLFILPHCNNVAILTSVAAKLSEDTWMSTRRDTWRNRKVYNSFAFRSNKVWPNWARWRKENQVLLLPRWIKSHCLSQGSLLLRKRAFEA